MEPIKWATLGSGFMLVVGRLCAHGYEHIDDWSSSQYGISLGFYDASIIQGPSLAFTITTTQSVHTYLSYW